MAQYFLFIPMKKLLSLLLISILLFVACGKKPEKERFIDATVEVTCMVFESGDIFDPALEEKTKAIFEDHGFDVEDEAAMQEIAQKYQDDADVQTAVEEALKECAGDLFEGMEEEENVEGSEEEGDEAMEEETEEEATDDAEETEEPAKP